jgi:hypothetical protein
MIIYLLGSWEGRDPPYCIYECCPPAPPPVASAGSWQALQRGVLSVPYSVLDWKD